jgi:hypothetical protein
MNDNLIQVIDSPAQTNKNTIIGRTNLSSISKIIHSLSYFIYLAYGCYNGNYACFFYPAAATIMGGWAIGILFWKKHGQNIYLWLFLKFNTNTVNNNSFFGFWNANFVCLAIEYHLHKS